MADYEEPVVEEFAEEEVVIETELEDDEVLSDEVEVKLFGKWSFNDIEVLDMSLVVSCEWPIAETKER